MVIEVYTARYAREHGHKPQGKGFWRLILVSQNVPAKDHTLVLDQPMIYPEALEKAQEPPDCASGSSSSHRERRHLSLRGVAGSKRRARGDVLLICAMARCMACSATTCISRS
jgi:hypothetical protein